MPHIGDILRERHRRRTDVRVGVEILARAIASGIGQRISIGGRSRSVRAAHLDEALRARVFNQRFEKRERQSDAVGEFESGGFTAV